MNSHDIRMIIVNAIEEEERMHKLSDILARTVGPDKKQLYFDFIKDYIQQTPDLLDDAYSAAQTYGVLSQFQPVFNAVFSYWDEEYDFIPDTLGLIGLSDDAYLSLSLIQQISESKIPNTNVPLLNINLYESNLIMRTLIGEPVASQLDSAVSQVFQSPTIQNTLINLLNDPGLGGGMPIGGGWDSTISNYEIDRAVDVQMGALGIV